MRALMMTLLALGLSAAALVSGVSEAHAQEGVITLDDTVIKGRIQKPEAFYILQHANLSYETLDLKPSFLEDLKETVDSDPFQ